MREPPTAIRPSRDATGFLQHGVIAGGCFPAASSLTGLGLALAKEGSHGAVCWPGRITEGDEPLRGGSNGHDPLARQVCVDTGEHCRCPRPESTCSDTDRPRERAAVDLALARAESAGSAGRLPGCAPCEGSLIVAAQQDGCQ